MSAPLELEICGRNRLPDVEFHSDDNSYFGDYADPLIVETSVLQRIDSISKQPSSHAQCWKGTPNNFMTKKWSIDTKNVLLVVLGLFVGLAFTAACNPPNVFLKEFNLATQTFRINDIIVGPKRPPLILYYMIFSTMAYIMSVASIVVLLWQLPLAMVLLLVAIAISFVFGLAVYSNTPQFLVAIGSNYIIPSSYFVCLSATAFILLGLLSWLIVKIFCRICTTKARRTTPRG